MGKRGKPFRKRSELVQPTRKQAQQARGLPSSRSPCPRPEAIPQPRRQRLSRRSHVHAGARALRLVPGPELASPLERGVDAGGATAARVFLDHMKLKLVAFDSPSISPDSLRKVEGAEGRVEEVDFVPSDHDLPTAARFPDARSAVGSFPNGQANGRQPTRLDTQPVPSQLRRCGITRRFLRVGGRCGRLACRACRAGLRSG